MHFGAPSKDTSNCLLHDQHGGPPHMGWEINTSWLSSIFTVMLNIFLYMKWGCLPPIPVPVTISRKSAAVCMPYWYADPNWSKSCTGLGWIFEGISTPMDSDEVFSNFHANKKQPLPPVTHTSSDWNNDSIGTIGWNGRTTIFHCC